MLISPIKTNRLLIRQFELNDWGKVYEYTSDSEVMTYIPEGIFTEAQAKEFVVANRGEQTRAYAVLRRQDRDLIGHMVFHPWFAPQTYEIGWVFHKASHGKGYATEAACSLLRYSFETLHLHRVIATCQPENIPSHRVMEKLGMRREGWFRKCIYRGDNTWWDEYFYAMLEEEWFKTAMQHPA